jgi:hypothetical protein
MLCKEQKHIQNLTIHTKPLLVYCQKNLKVPRNITSNTIPQKSCTLIVIKNIAGHIR